MTWSVREGMKPSALNSYHHMMRNTWERETESETDRKKARKKKKSEKNKRLNNAMLEGKVVTVCGSIYPHFLTFDYRYNIARGLCVCVWCCTSWGWDSGCSQGWLYSCCDWRSCNSNAYTAAGPEPDTKPETPPDNFVCPTPVTQWYTHSQQLCHM